MRFGFEIFVPYLQQAMEETDKVNLPWESSLIRIAEEISLSNANQRKQLRYQEKRVKDLEKRNDPTAQFRDMKAYRYLNDRVVETYTAHALSDKLKDAEIIHGNRYEYMASAGDLDGLVVGTWEGEEVVVLIEAKHSMDASYLKAQKELIISKAYWAELVNLNPADPEVDVNQLEDYDALQITRHKHRRVMCAYGAVRFSDHIAEKHFPKNEQWFKVVPNAAGKFTAEAVS